MSDQKRTLYRNSKLGKVGGVCAGIANYFGLETWLVRVLMASAIILTGFFGLPLLCYVVAWFVLDNEPEVTPDVQEQPISVKSTVWQSGELPRQALHDIKHRFGDLEGRLQHLEQHVTSSAFNLRREIDQL
ncbi:envelope stress response membrane protein PspC [Neiella marina]|uniref:Envelope stress response membrane protein PspC n=1 Tax=Neiella holothuriorum TaxID=2870530 RepID=A0ABS7EDP5_9GAMM|nr:envelope stress response membrane protein PspC [Neiella holothuriorum]MBW8190370.1 envelope stress response membrane protein PspC [Neiella holothuriorum]